MMWSTKKNKIKFITPLEIFLIWYCQDCNSGAQWSNSIYSLAHVEFTYIRPAIYKSQEQAFVHWYTRMNFAKHDPYASKWGYGITACLCKLQRKKIDRALYSIINWLFMLW